MSDFGALFNKLIDEEAARLSERFGVDAHYDRTPITVNRIQSYVPMSLEMAMDAGLLTEEQARAQGWTPPEPVKIPWRTRARWRWQAWRERAGRKVGGWLAGVDLTEREDDW